MKNNKLVNILIDFAFKKVFAGKENADGCWNYR